MTIKRLPVLMGCLLLGACTSNPPRDTSTLDHINTELQQVHQGTVAAQDVPESVSNSLLPPLRIAMPKASAKQLQQRFDLVVNEAPANQVLMGIVSGTRYSMLVHPDVKGNISVNLKDVTVFEALDAVRDLYGYDYRVEGSRIFVMKPGLQAKVYKVNYITGIRRGSSDIRVTSGAGDSSGSSSSSGNSNSSSRQMQASNLNMSARTDFWGEMEDGVRTIVGCRIPSSTTQTSTSSSSTSGSTSTSTTSTGSQGEFNSYGSRDRGMTGCPEGKAVVVNQMAGTMLVRAMPDELRTVEGMLRTMQVSIEKQVILEAKIIDVELNKSSQQGINWAGFQQGKHRVSVGADTTTIGETGNNGGTLTTGSTLGSVLGTGLVGATGGAFAAGLGIALQIRNFSAMLNFLQTQGEVNVLSSPRIATTNNQKAVLKVGRDEQFVTGFESNSNTTTTTGGTTVNLPTPVYSTFFSGISLDVTPQIDDDGNITLHVHPLVSEVTEVQKNTINNQTLPFASNKISETDSVVKVKDGQIVVIGGLMTDSYSDTRSGVPGASKAPVVGAAFRKGGQESSKRELVIMIKPTVVQDNTAWEDDLSATQQRIEHMGAEIKP
jgi:MSHA biogenesis protein MshL